jgi:uncharacterized protein YuzE
MPGGMKLAYHADTDSLYVEFTERPSVESTEIAAGVVVDFDGQGRVVGIDIDNARNKVKDAEAQYPRQGSNL